MLNPGKARPTKKIETREKTMKSVLAAISFAAAAGPGLAKAGGEA